MNDEPAGSERTILCHIFAVVQLRDIIMDL